MDTQQSVPFDESLIEAAYYDLEGASKIAAHTTKCKRKGVACMLVPFVHSGNESPVEYCRRRVYTNGPLRDDERFCSGEIGDCGCIHAEMNAITATLREDAAPYDEYALFCNYSPCTNCANLIVKSGIIRAVIYVHDTMHDMRGIDVLRVRGGILVERFSDYEV